MPVTDWTTQNPNPLFGAPPNCGAGCSANSWNVPSYDPDRDSIPSKQWDIDGPLQPVVVYPWDYETVSSFDDDMPGIIRGTSGFGDWFDTGTEQISDVSFTEVDLHLQNHAEEILAELVPGYLILEMLTGTLVYQYTSVTYYTAEENEALHGSFGLDVVYVSGPTEIIPDGTSMVVTLSQSLPVVNDPQQSPVFFYTTVDTVTGPGQVALDSVPVSDDWGAPTNQFKSIQVHKVDTRSVDHSPFINSLGSGGLVRITHPNGVALFTVNGVIEFDPEYGILLQYSSGDLTPVGSGQEIAIDFLPAGVL